MGVSSCQFRSSYTTWNSPGLSFYLLYEPPRSVYLHTVSPWKILRVKISLGAPIILNFQGLRERVSTPPPLRTPMSTAHIGSVMMPTTTASVAHIIAKKFKATFLRYLIIMFMYSNKICNQNGFWTNLRYPQYYKYLYKVFLLVFFL